MLAMYIIGLLSLPSLPAIPNVLQQLRHHHMEMFTSAVFNISHVQLFPSLRFFFLFPVEEFSGRIPLRNTDVQAVAQKLIFFGLA